MKPLGTGLRRTVRLFLTLSAFAVLGGVPLGAQGQPEGDGPWMVRAWFGDAAMKRAVGSWGEHFADRSDKGYLLIEADAERLAALRALGFFVDLDAERTGWIRDGEAAARAAREAVERGELAIPLAGIPGYPCYRTVEESYAAMQAMAAAHPTLAAVVDVGDSWLKSQAPTDGIADGYDMLVLVLTNTAIAGPKPKLFVTSSIHAREYTPAELVLRFAEELVAGYGVDADATWLLNEHEIHLMVQANPDGRKQAETGLSWRKNANNGYCADTNNRGADLNRNFDFQWGCCGGSSPSACAETYRGASGGSEPEIQAIQSYLRALFPDQRGPLLTDAAPADATGVYLDIHSYSSEILTPWGFVDPNDSPNPNGPAFSALARKFALLSGYDPALFVGYLVDGASDDFAYGELGVAAVPWEMGTAFFESCASFEANVLPAGLPMLRYAAKVVRTPYLTPSGPDELTLAAAPLAVPPGDPVTLTADVSDARFSNQNGVEPVQPIAAAEAYVDLPPWRAGALPIALDAADGTFDEVSEGVTGAVPTDGLASGRHTLFLRAEDSSGAWGAVSAIFFYVLDPATAASVDGVVREQGSALPLAATVRVGPFSTQSDGVTGAYSIAVPPGSYDLEASAGDHATQAIPGLDLDPLESATQDFELVPYTTFVSSDAEIGSGGWTAQAPWALTAEAAASPTHSWTDSPGASYGNNASTALTSPLVNLGAATSVSVTFRQLRDLENTYDFGRLEVSTNGGANWSEVAHWDGEGQNQVWQSVDLTVPALAGAAAARIRFRLTSDGFVTFDGWHVDDIVLRAVMGPSYIFVDSFEQASSLRWSTTQP